jgi:putative flippase GtrA
VIDHFFEFLETHEKLAGQVARFASVGVVSTAINVLGALTLNHFAGIAPLTANFLGFLVAVLWSYLGNWAWTFGAKDRVKSSAPKFFLMASITFALNQSIVFWVTKVEGLSLAIAMIPVVAIIPAFSFWLARTHIFTRHRAV